MQHDGGRYFGPFTNSKAVRMTLELVRKIFPYLTCKREITGRDRKPCLYYHIKRCPGPCIGAASQEEYRASVQQLMQFLHGQSDQVVADLRRRMQVMADVHGPLLRPLERQHRKTVGAARVTLDDDFAVRAHDEPAETRVAAVV